MRHDKSKWSIGLYLGLALSLLWMRCALAADGFGGGVTPSRFEVAANAGDIVRRSFEIYNFGDRPSEFTVSTADWNYSDLGAISFFNPLAENSCRPWVHLERHSVEVVPSRTLPSGFRFEVHVPEDATRGECRFAIMLDADQKPHQAVLNNGAIALPIVGRIGIIVYIAIGGAAPELKINEVLLANQKGQWSPQLNISNAGDAHGRIDSDVYGILPSGKRVAMSVATSPILAGQTRNLPITITDDVADAALYPLKIGGKVYTDQQAFKLEATLAP